MNILKTATTYIKVCENWTQTGAPEIETVDMDFYNRFADAKTLRFFRSLGGTESVVKRGNVVKCTSIPPDKTERKVTTFAFNK
jgi:hypothetical protein